MSWYVGIQVQETFSFSYVLNFDGAQLRVLCGDRWTVILVRELDILYQAASGRANVDFNDIRLDCLSIIWPISAYRIVCQQTLPVVAWILDVNNVSE